MITADKLLQAGLVFHTDKADEIAQALDSACTEYDISTKNRVVGFLAQCVHESDRFRLSVECMNYTVQLLLDVWPKRFTPELAAQYAHKPEALGNFVYANRLGNGDVASGDGYRYRGRGYIQITGKENYIKFGQAVGEDFVAQPELVGTPKYAALSAAWFWKTHGLNELAETRDVIAMTKRVNGGTVGLASRKQYYAKADEVF